MKIRFFLLPYISPTQANDAIEAVGIAEGLKKAGITYYANIDYWLDPIKQEYLFHKAPDDFEADVHVYYNTFYFAQDMTRLKEVDHSKINILLDRSDELIPFWQTPPYQDLKKFDLLLIDHFNTHQYYPPGYNVKPWQIGFTRRVIDYDQKFSANPVKDIILDSYRLHHNLRLLAISKLRNGLDDVYPTQRMITDTIEDNDVKLDNIDRTYWQMTGRRHNPQYFDQLNSALFTYVFGGFYHLNPTTFSFADKFKRRINKVLAAIYSGLGKDNGKFYFVYQWDSYRLWEALLANTCPVFLDFEYWGFKLPVNPVNGEHYIGVNGFDFESTINKIRNMSKEEILRIGEAGKKWAIENYGPEALARHFIEEVKQTEKYKVNSAENSIITTPSV